MRLIMTLICIAIVSCSHQQDFKDMTVPFVDLERYSGDWFVQGHVHLWLDKGAKNQVERYKILDDGSIDISFLYQKPEAQELSETNMTAKIHDKQSQAHWKVQFIWPFTSDFLVVRLEDNYAWTVVSVPQKNMIWIMSREKNISDSLYSRIVSDLAADGYAVEKLDRVVQD